MLNSSIPESVIVYAATVVGLILAALFGDYLERSETGNATIQRWWRRGLAAPGGVKRFVLALPGRLKRLVRKVLKVRLVLAK